MKRILLTYMESGMGHITSMQSIADALKNYNNNNVEIVESYIMQEDKDPALIKFNNFIIEQTKNTNRIWGFGNFIFGLLEFLGGPRFMVWVHHTLFKKALNHTLAAIDKRKPDAIVSTHYFTTLCAVEYKKRYNPNCLVVTYNPDNNTHPWWDKRDGFFMVNNTLALKQALKRGFKKENVKEVYFTARNQILNAKVDKAYYRQKWGIDPNKFCVLIADGAYASAKSTKVCRALLKTNLPLTIIMLAGKNEKVFNEFKAMEGHTNPNITLKTQGFTREVYELYCASDLFITKAGPNAILDSVYMQTPVLVDYYAHPIEKASTSLFVDELKCGVKAFKIKKIVAEVDKFVKNPALLEQYRANCRKLDKTKNGAKEVANLVMKELSTTNE